MSFYYTTQFTTRKKKGLGNMYSRIDQECLVWDTVMFSVSEFIQENRLMKMIMSLLGLTLNILHS